MEELYRTNDPVLLSVIGSVLSHAGIVSLNLDRHTSIAQGSVHMIQQRIMVHKDDKADAQKLLRDAGIEGMV